MIENPFEVAPVLAISNREAITDHDARLIFDLVSNMQEQSKVIERYGITAEDLAAKVRNPAWAQAYAETKKVWNSDMNTAQRIRLKAAFLLEDSLPNLFAIIRDAKASVPNKLAAIEQLTRISTVNNVPKDSSGGGERHSITINIGKDRPPVTIVQETT